MRPDTDVVEPSCQIALDAGRDEFQRKLFIRSTVGIQEFNAREKLVTQTWVDAWGGAASLDARNPETTRGHGSLQHFDRYRRDGMRIHFVAQVMLPAYVLYGRKSE